jgi:hypothetical protein
LGAYALVVAGLGHATPALTVLGLVEGDTVCALPPALLQHFVRHSGVELSEHGRRKLERAPTNIQGQIGRPIGGVIGELIGSAPEREGPFNASEWVERPQRSPGRIIPGIVRDSSDSTPPPTPPAGAGGGQQKLHKRQAGTPAPKATPVLETDATRLLRAIEVRPAQQIELAGLALTTVEAAIADGRARQGIRDLAGWVVYLLRQHRDHGWTPPPPAPHADAPEALGAYFAQREAEQATGRAAERPTEMFSNPAHAMPPPAAAQPPSLADLWQEVLPGLRLRLPREVYQSCVRQTKLIDVAAAWSQSESLTHA